MSEEYEVFAISDDGTETVANYGTKQEATREKLRLIGLLGSGKWENNTSLENVKFFGVDTGPGNELRK